MADKITVRFTLNQKERTELVDPSARLVDVIRYQFGLTGTKEGCAVGECGACTVLMDGRAVTSCSVLAGQIDGKEIYTIEGMEDTRIGSILQEQFIDKGAVQCGFCTPGMILSAYALLLQNPSPTRDEIRLGLSGNLCRCTGYIQIIDAVEAAAKKIREGGEAHFFDGLAECEGGSAQPKKKKAFGRTTSY